MIFQLVQVGPLYIAAIYKEKYDEDAKTMFTSYKLVCA